MAFGWTTPTSAFASVVKKPNSWCSPSIGFDFVPRFPRQAVQMPAKKASGRSLLKANQVGVLRGFVSAILAKGCERHDTAVLRTQPCAPVGARDELLKRLPELLQKHLPTILWFTLAILLLVLLRHRITRLLTLIEWRLKAGAPIKLSAFELGAVQVPPGRKVPSNPALVRVDETGEFAKLREEMRDLALFLVHRLSPSAEDGQLYDVVIYVVMGLKSGTLLNVKRVEYYFGDHWNRNVYTSLDRASGFSISTSAWAPFTCTARLHFMDGREPAVLHRHVDFEMGPLGGPKPTEARATKRVE